jgi:peptidoglycan/xylan/chitin deacetylase (PgdA/CDA1 family)
LRFAVLVAAVLSLPLQATANGHEGSRTSRPIEVLFTFDDGPDDRYTPTILDDLKRHGVRAVFYMIGNRLLGKTSVVRRDIALRVVREGHHIGNHTLSHSDLCRMLPERAATEIDKATTTLENVTGVTVRLFRPPYGASCKRLTEQLRERQLITTPWNVDPQEWQHKNADQVARHVIARLANGRGRMVILLHDNQRVTMQALPRILDWIDEENQRRLDSGAPAIRLLSGDDIEVEPVIAGAAAPAATGAPAWSDWVFGSLGRARERFRRAVYQLAP